MPYAAAHGNSALPHIRSSILGIPFVGWRPRASACRSAPRQRRPFCVGGKARRAVAAAGLAQAHAYSRGLFAFSTLYSKHLMPSVLARAPSRFAVFGGGGDMCDFSRDDIRSNGAASPLGASRSFRNDALRHVCKARYRNLAFKRAAPLTAAPSCAIPEAALGSGPVPPTTSGAVDPRRKVFVKRTPTDNGCRAGVICRRDAGSKGLSSGQESPPSHHRKQQVSHGVGPHFVALPSL